MASGKKIYWVGWARRVGESDWHSAVHVVGGDNPYVGWRWIEDNWTIRSRHCYSFVMLRTGETPYRRMKSR